MKGAKTFFEAKVNEISRASRFEQEIKGEAFMTSILHSTTDSHTHAHFRGTRKEEERDGGSCRKEESIQGKSIHVALVLAVTQFL